MQPATERAAAFGDLTPLIARRQVAVVGASDREGNLGGLAVSFLQKFGYRGPVWPVKPAMLKLLPTRTVKASVDGARCGPALWMVRVTAVRAPSTTVVLAGVTV